MKTRNLFPFVCAVIIAAAILAGLAVARRSAARTLQAGISAAETLDRQMQVLRSRNAALGNWKAELTKAQALLRKTGQTQSASNNSAATTETENAAFVRMLSTNPTLLAAWKTRRKITLQRIYGLLIRQLGLSTDQADHYLAILAENELRQADIDVLRQTAGLALSNSQMQSFRQEQTQDLQAEERALLGDEGFQQAQDFERLQEPQDAVTSLVRSASVTEPLSLEQGQQLLQAFETASDQYQHGGNLDLSTVDWVAVEREAQNILSPTQYATFVGDTIPQYRPRAEMRAAMDAAEQADAKAAAAQ